MAHVPIDTPTEEDAVNDGANQDVQGEEADPGADREQRRRRGPPEVEIEREVTKRHLIQALTSVVVVILYMAFTLLRDRDSGVVVIDEDEDDTAGPEDDWKEA